MSFSGALRTGRMPVPLLMMKNWLVIILLLAIVGLPFLLRKGGGGTGWREGDPVIVIVTPHNEAIRYEFERGVSRWHQERYRSPVKIQWRGRRGDDGEHHDAPIL